nr:hypothetical protein [Tanacetum cinerariifolium]
GGTSSTLDLTLHSTCRMKSLFLDISSSVPMEYLASVAKYKKYLANERGSHLDSPALMPTKPAKEPKSTEPKAPPKPSVSILVTSAQTAPATAPAKPQEKKHKQATETSDKPPKAKKSKHRRVTKIRSLKSVAESEAEEVPTVEPQVADHDADYQKAMEESMKTAYALPWGRLPLVVIREPESKKYQPLPEVPGKSKAKVTEEQSDSNEESKKVVLGATTGCNDEDQAGSDPGAQAKGQTGTDAGTLDEGQAGLNPDEMSEGHAGPDPGNAGDEEQSIPSHVVHAGSDREHMDLDVADILPQPFTEQLDEGNKPSDADKNTKTKVESMVNVPIQQAVSSISLMTSPIIDLTSRPVSPKVHQQFKATTTNTTTTKTTTLPPPQAQQQSTAEAMMAKRVSELEHIMANLIRVNKEIEERSFTIACGKLNPTKLMKITNSCLKPLKSQCHSEELAEELAEARKKKKKRPFKHSRAPGAFESSQVPPPLPPPPSTSHENLEMDEDTSLDEQAQLSDDEDIESSHIPKVNLRHDWWKPLEEERPATPEPAWSIPSSDAPVPPNNWASALASNYSPPPEESLLAQTDNMATFIDWFCKR